MSMCSKSMEAMLESDEAMLMVMPIVVYWLYAGVYEALSCFSGLNCYGLHSRKEEQRQNSASKAQVVKGVLLQQGIQATITLLLSKVFFFFFFTKIILNKIEINYYSKLRFRSKNGDLKNPRSILSC